MNFKANITDNYLNFIINYENQIITELNFHDPLSASIYEWRNLCEELLTPLCVFTVYIGIGKSYIQKKYMTLVFNLEDKCKCSITITKEIELEFKKLYELIKIEKEFKLARNL